MEQIEDVIAHWKTTLANLQATPLNWSTQWAQNLTACITLLMEDRIRQMTPAETPAERKALGDAIMKDVEDMRKIAEGK